MSHVSSSPLDASSSWPAGLAAARLLSPIVLCIWILVFVTFSPPEDWKASRFGTAPILPPMVLKLGKLVGRGTAAGIIAFAFLTAVRSPRLGTAIGALAPLLVFAAFGLLSVTWSALPVVTLTQGVTFSLLVLIATYIATVWTGEGDTERLLWHLTLALLGISSTLLLICFVMPQAGALTRQSSGVLHGTNASATAALGIVATMVARFVWRSKWNRWWPAIIAVHGAVLVISGNRLSLAMTALVTALVVLVHMQRAYLAGAGLAAALLGLTYLCLDPGLQLVDQAVGGLGTYVRQGQTATELSKLSGRSEMWQAMWRSYWEAPLRGHGFFVTSSSGRIYVWDEWGNWTAHNLLLQVLTTTGIIGLVLLVGGFGWLAVGIYRSRCIGPNNLETRNGRSIATVLFFSTWFCGWGLLNESFMGPLQPESVVFAVMIGIAAAVAGTQGRLRWHAARNRAAVIGRESDR